MVYFKIVAGFIVKMFTLKKGSLFLLSAGLSLGFSYYLDLLFVGVEIRDVVIAIVAELVFVTIFMLFTTIDLVTGIQAAFYLNTISSNPIPKDKVIKSSKLWRTFWKGFGVVVLTMMLMFLAIFTVVLKSNVSYWVAIWSLVCFWIMACGFEFYSIGENLAKRNGGTKHPIFGFVDKVLNAIQKKAISKIDNSFDMLEEVKRDTDINKEEEDNRN